MDIQQTLEAQVEAIRSQMKDGNGNMGVEDLMRHVRETMKGFGDPRPKDSNAALLQLKELVCHHSSISSFCAGIC